MIGCGEWNWKWQFLSKVSVSLLFSPPSTEIRYTVSRFIKYGISFNMYMFHGGTNFGFINGAFHYDKHSSVVTSYGKWW